MCGVYLYILAFDYGFFASFGYLNVCGTCDVFVVWCVVTGAALALSI